MSEITIVFVYEYVTKRKSLERVRIPTHQTIDCWDGL